MEMNFRPPIVKRLMLVALSLFAAMLPLAGANGQGPAARSLLVASFKGVITPTAPFDLVQSVSDFSPGAKTQVISTTTPHYLSVLSGELAVSVNGTAETVVAGKGVAVPAGALLSLSNRSESRAARLFASTLLEVSATAEVHQLATPGVGMFGSARRTMLGSPGVMDVVQVAAAYEPGYRTANHVMNEFHLMLHTSGQVSYSYLDGGAETYAAGSQAVMHEGRAGWMGNPGTVESSMAWTWIATPGKPLTTALPASPAPAPPNTGTGIAREEGGANRAVIALLLVVATAASAAVIRRACR